MANTGSAIGIMDPAFFVGKNVLLAWLNDFFQAGYTKVEQMSNGAMACQIMDAIYPGKVALGKVNFDAKTQPESVSNFKVLQSVFDKEQISKYVDVSKLLNGKFQDNLEFLQYRAHRTISMHEAWLKSYFDKNYGGQEYNAVERREQARSQYKKGHKFAGTSAKIASAPSAAASASAVLRASNSAAASRSVGAASGVAKAPARAAAPARAVASARKSPAASTARGSTPPASELQAQVDALSTAMEGLEKERAFYFGKLREIEILLQEGPEPDGGIDGLKKAVLDILYMTDEAAEFQVPDEAAVDAEDGGLPDGAGEGLLDEAELTETF